MPGGMRGNQAKILGTAGRTQRAGRAQLRGTLPCVSSTLHWNSLWPLQCCGWDLPGSLSPSPRRASPCAWSQGVLLPLQAGTSLCSPELPGESLEAQSQAELMPSWTPAAPTNHRELGQRQSFAKLLPKKRPREAQMLLWEGAGAAHAQCCLPDPCPFGT